MDPKALSRYLQRYEEKIGKIAGFYYRLNRDSGAFDFGDLEQAGRMAVLNISRKRPEKLNIPAYVHAAIRYAILDEMRKMGHREKHVYLVIEDETTPLVDVFPTKEKGEKFDELEELLYRIKHEFSQREAEGLMRLLEKCDNIYDLNLTQPPSTDTKDRVKVVTRMDLNDEEMRIYAEVLLGVRSQFPLGYVASYDKGNQEARNRAQKFLLAILEALEITPKEFSQLHLGTKIFRKYRLMSFYHHAYLFQIGEVIKDLDETILHRDGLQYEMVDKIRDSYDRHNGNASGASRDLNCSKNSILRYWKKLGFVINSAEAPSPLSEKERNEIIAAHKTYDGNASEAARHLLYSKDTFLRYWKRLGLKIKHPGSSVGPHLSQLQIMRIIGAYSKCERNVSKASKYLHHAPITISKYWKEAGLKI